MAEALEKVRRDLGKDAIILHTRTFRRGGILGVGARNVVEITASTDPRALEASERRMLAGDAEGRAPRVVVPGPKQGAAGGLENESASTRGGLPRDDGRIGPASCVRPTGAEVGFHRAPAGGSFRSEHAPEPGRRDFSSLAAGLHKEMTEIRAMVHELLNRPSVTGRSMRRQALSNEAALRPPFEAPAELQGFYTRLLQNAVAEELADEIMVKARERLAECRARIVAAVGRRVDPAVLQQKVAEKLAQLVPAVLVESIERMLPPPGPVTIDAAGGPRVVVLVGPTGVGKTTTIAKLAAHFKLRENRRVGLVTADTYRIAAVDQLKAYAEIMGLSLEVVFEPDEVAGAFERLVDCDLILMDTSGRSHRDTRRIEELGRFLAAARHAAGQLWPADASSQPPVEVHLLLSCTSDESQLLDVAERFSAVQVDRVAFTKLDEAVGLGVVLNVASRLKWQLSYLTTGQDVPHDIEVGHRRRIAEWLLNGLPASPAVGGSAGAGTKPPG